MNKSNEWVKNPQPIKNSEEDQKFRDEAYQYLWGAGAPTK